MGYYVGYFTLKVEGAKKVLEAVREAVKNYDMSALVNLNKKDKNLLIVEEMYKINDADDAYNFAQVIARAVNGADFVMEGSIEYSVSADSMGFLIELKDGKLTLRSSDWYIMYTPDMLEDYETYEEYCEDQSDIKTEESFVLAQENEETYLINGEIHVELPYGEAICLEY